MRQFLWKFVQFGVFAAVLFSNIRINGLLTVRASVVRVACGRCWFSAIPIMVADLARLARRARSGVGGCFVVSLVGEKRRRYSIDAPIPACGPRT